MILIFKEQPRHPEPCICRPDLSRVEAHQAVQPYWRMGWIHFIDRAPFESELEELNWFGNTFDSKDNVAPLIVKNGDRVRFDDWGGASVSLCLDITQL